MLLGYFPPCATPTPFLGWTLWKGTQEFRYFSEQISFDQASDACQAEGGTLVIDNTLEKHLFLRRWIFNTILDARGVWIGGFYVGRPGVVSWFDASATESELDVLQRQLLPRDGTLSEPCLAIRVRDSR
jgi:hypothetical protein